MNEVLKAIKSRRSVRAYTAQQISQEDLNAILEAATSAPSGMNYQTWHFTAIQNAAVLLLPRVKSPVCRSVDTARPIAVIIMRLRLSSYPMNRRSGGQLWIVPVPCRISSLLQNLSE
mgnify:CR=1 FL=1